MILRGGWFLSKLLIDDSGVINIFEPSRRGCLLKCWCVVVQFAFCCLPRFLKSQLVFSLWHFLIHCYANLKISQGVSSKLCHLMICTADFLVKQVPLTNTIQTWRSTWRVVSTHAIHVWYIHKTFVADWHWMTFRPVTPVHHCKYSTPDASFATPSSSSSFGWQRRSRRRWAVADRLVSRPNHHLHQENDMSFGRQMGTMKTPRNKKQRHKETECIFDIWMYGWDI